MIAVARAYLGTFLGGMLFAMLFAAGVMSLDRSAPFEVLSVEPARVRPGEIVTIRAKVRRDTARGCAASFSRYLFDSASVRFDLGDASLSAAGIHSLERRTPGELIVTAMVPSIAARGPATIETQLEYVCNVAHRVWPITVITTLPFDIL